MQPRSLDGTLQRTCAVARHAMHRRSFDVSCLLTLGLLLAGCGQADHAGPQRVLVSGNATYQGTPIPFGEIRFIPQDNLEIPSYSVAIQNGAYIVDHRGGLPVGKYRVQILGWPSANTLPEGDVTRKALSENKQFIPVEFNAKSKIDFIVESSGKLNHNFEL